MGEGAEIWAEGLTLVDGPFSSTGMTLDTPIYRIHRFRHLPEGRFEGRETVEVPIDVNEVIEEIMLDPRLRAAGGEGKRQEWLKANGFRNAISTSMLYQKLIILVPLFKLEDLDDSTSTDPSKSETLPSS